MDAKPGRTEIEMSLRSVAYSLMVILSLMAYGSQWKESGPFGHTIGIPFIAISIFLMILLVLLNFSKVKYTTTNSNNRQVSLNHEDWFTAPWLVIGILLLFSLSFAMRVSYHEIPILQSSFEGQSESVSQYYYQLIQYFLFSLGICFFAWGSTVFLRNHGFLSEVYGQYDPIKRRLFVMQLVTYSLEIQDWRLGKKDFDEKLRKQLAGCIKTLSESESLDTSGNYWTKEKAWEAVCSELYTRVTREYGIEDSSFEKYFREYCKDQFLYEKFMDQFIESEMKKLAIPDSKYRITYRRLCNLLSLFECEGLIESDNGGEYGEFESKCKQILFALRSLKEDDRDERDSLYTLRREIIHLLRFIDKKFKGEGKMDEEAINNSAGEIELQMIPGLAENIRYHIGKGRYSLPDVRANKDEKSTYAKRLENITENLSKL